MEKNNSQEKIAEHLNSATKRQHCGIGRFYVATRKVSRNRGMGTTLAADQGELVRDRLQSLSETCGMSPCQQSPQSHQYLSGIEGLSRIFGVLQSEEAARQDGSTISFAAVEKEIAICIAGCLSDCPVQTRHIGRIRTLLRDYRVVTPLQDGTPTVSLRRLHMILQDNFQGSYLCGLLNIFLAGHNGVTTKVLDF